MAEITVFYEGSVVTRNAALKRGIKRYFTGKACSNGHVAQRQTKSGTCIVCSRLSMARRRSRNPEKYAEIDHRSHRKTHQKRLEQGRRYHQANRAVRNAQSRLYYREHREEIAERSRQRRIADPHRSRAASRRYYQGHRAESAKRGRQYRASEIGRRIKSTAENRRRAKKVNLPGSHTEADVQRLVAASAHCYLCGRRFTKRNPPTLDHVLAITDPLGTDDRSNLALACRPCNSAKRNRRINPLTGQGFLI
jgi:hypothetical protein